MRQDERRQHPRIETEVTVEVYTSTHHAATPEVAEICSVVDLSESGMRFKAGLQFINTQLLRLTFLLPDSMVIIRSDAEVVHLQKRKNKKIEVGVAFKNISAAQRTLIRHFVKKELSVYATT